MSPTEKHAQALLAEQGITADKVLNRLKWLAGMRSDVDLAKLLKVSKGTVSAWRRRNKIPYEEVLSLQFTNDIDFVYCIFGRTIHQLVEADIAKQLNSAAEQTKFWKSILRGMERLRSRSNEGD